MNQLVKIIEKNGNQPASQSVSGTLDLSIRPRRLRRSPGLRAMVRETELNAQDFIYPLFVTHGTALRQPIRSMPGVFSSSAFTGATSAGSFTYTCATW